MLLFLCFRDVYVNIVDVRTSNDNRKVNHNHKSMKIGRIESSMKVKEYTKNERRKKSRKEKNRTGIGENRQV